MMIKNRKTAVALGLLLAQQAWADPQAQQLDIVQVQGREHRVVTAELRVAGNVQHRGVGGHLLQRGQGIDQGLIVSRARLDAQVEPLGELIAQRLGARTFGVGERLGGAILG